MKLALEEWQHLLDRAQWPITIFTDHKNVEYLQSFKGMNPCQVRCAFFFFLMF